MLVSAEVNGTAPAEGTIIAGGTYELGGWAVQAFEIDLTDVNYNGPVYVCIDTLPGTFALFASVEFIGGEIDYSKPVEPETPVEPEGEKLEIDIANTTAVATDPAWIPNQALLGPHNAADDKTGQIGAINNINNNFLGDTGYGNIIVGGYISVGEIDLSKCSSVTLLVAGGGAGENYEGWMTDAEGNKLNAENATFTAGAAGVEGTQTIRTITISFDTDYNGEVRFLFTQSQVVTVVGITFKA
jgi:hypothetical protein